jgi:nitroimidazol reductase NimA-like FMN-containing flavoprotein (pyridoxamine 5'-phosphate oxidase superfamily)
MGSSTGPSEFVVEMDELDVEVCWWLIARTRFGRVAFVADGVPAVRPVNCGVLNRHVVFRTGADSALGRMADGSPVAFEVDETDQVAKSGWSVIVTGHLSPLTDADELGRLGEFDLHPWAPGVRDRWMKVTPTSVSGREVTRHRDFAASGQTSYTPPDGVGDAAAE